MSHNNPNGERGTRFAIAVVEVMAANGFPHAEHRRTRGPRDAGDIAGALGLVFQTKDLASENLGAGVKAAQVQKANAGADFGIYVKKRRGKHAREAYAVLPLVDILRLLRMAGYGDPLPDPPRDGRVTVEKGFSESLAERARAMERPA